MKDMVSGRDFLSQPGRISLVGAGPGAADLLTLRALERIRAADVVFYDRLVDAEVLALIPERTEMVNVGKEVGRNEWPQARIERVIVQEALKGRRVVRLKSGDPSIFGRAKEEIEAAERHGIEVEIVPGITAASAAAASALQPLTERGQFERLEILTGTALTGAMPEDIARGLRPGTRLAIYMGVHTAGPLAEALMAAGVRADAPVLIAERVATRRERRVQCTLGQLVATILLEGIENPALILVDHCKVAVAQPVGVSHFAAVGD